MSQQDLLGLASEESRTLLFYTIKKPFRSSDIRRSRDSHLSIAVSARVGRRVCHSGRDFNGVIETR